MIIIFSIKNSTYYKMSSTEEKKLPNMTTISNLRQESKSGETKAGTGETLYLYDRKNNCDVRNNPFI